MTLEKNLATLFQNRAYRNGVRPSFSYKIGNEWKTLTWEDMGKRVERIGRGLLAHGIGPGDRVAIFAANSPMWVMCDLAILSIGGVSVPIYPNTNPSQAEFILRHSESKVVFVSPDPQKALTTVLANLPGLQVLSHDEASMTQLEARGGEVSIADFYQRMESVGKDDMATLIYTSGTTGEPKGVMLTHGNILANCRAAASVFPIAPADTCLSFLPLSHALERTAGFYTMIYIGANIAFAENIAKLAQNLGEVKPTVLISVPRILEKLFTKIQAEMATKPKVAQFLFKKAIDQKLRPLSGFHDKLFFKKIRDQLGGHLKFIICGGAAMNPTIGMFFRSVGFEILEGYGLTEASPVVAVNLPTKNKLGTVGPALPGLEVKIADDGEVLVRGASIMKGYYKDPASTSQAIDGEGYLHTGDIGIIDTEGFLKLTDRKKELIVTSGGKNIAPQMLENELKAFPLVEQACVIGDGQKYLAALLVPNFDLLEQKAKAQKVSFQTREDLVQNTSVRQWFSEIIEGVNSKVSGHESIKKFALLSQEFSIENEEITPTLKLKRKMIQKRHSSTIQSLFT